MDSKLVVEQMSGNWKIKHENMKILVEKANLENGKLNHLDGLVLIQLCKWQK
ncbi:MAG: hypothetical protein RJA80_1199 [Actinomycetota bacterium]